MSMDLKRTVEALLFASPEPLPLGRIQSILPRTDRRRLREVLDELKVDYDNESRAFQLREIGGGWRVVTRSEHSRSIEKLLQTTRKVRLSRAALECLAVVAYRQPCTRFDVDQVRGVNSGGAISTLLEKNMVKITGRADSVGRPLLYATTEDFLSHLGINRVEDLPQLSEIEALLAPADADAMESPVIPEERRQRLLAGVDRIEEMMGAASDAENPKEPEEDSREVAPAFDSVEPGIEELLRQSRDEERAALEAPPAPEENLDLESLAGEEDWVPIPVTQGEAEAEVEEP